MEKYLTFEDYQKLWHRYTQMCWPNTEYQGIKLFPGMAQRVDELKTWPIRKDDAFVVTYIKAGTTWAQEIMSCVMHDGNLEEVNKKHTSFRVPFLEFDFPEELRRPIKLPTTLEIVSEMPSPRVIKTHLPGQLLPLQLWEKKPKIVYVLRNPKDVVVSCFYFSKLAQPDPAVLAKTFGVFFDEMLAGTTHYGPWWDHYLYFWKRRHEGNILLLRFEDMKRDLLGSVQKISRFLNKDLSAEKLDAIAQHCAFANMKKNPAANQGGLFDKSTRQEGAVFMRKGKVGDWKSHFTVAQNEAMDALIREKLHGTGLTFDYE